MTIPKRTEWNVFDLSVMVYADDRADDKHNWYDHAFDRRFNILQHLRMKRPGHMQVLGGRPIDDVCFGQHLVIHDVFCSSPIVAVDIRAGAKPCLHTIGPWLAQTKDRRQFEAIYVPTMMGLHVSLEVLENWVRPDVQIALQCSFSS